jgi:hypothetical protein
VARLSSIKHGDPWLHKRLCVTCLLSQVGR